MKIANIVFYYDKDNDENGEVEKALIFYKNGKTRVVPKNDAIELLIELVKNNAITNQEIKDSIHVMSTKELEKKYTSFVSTEEQEYMPPVVPENTEDDDQIQYIHRYIPTSTIAEEGNHSVFQRRNSQIQPGARQNIINYPSSNPDDIQVFTDDNPPVEDNNTVAENNNNIDENGNVQNTTSENEQHEQQEQSQENNEQNNQPVNRRPENNDTQEDINIITDDEEPEEENTNEEEIEEVNETTNQSSENNNNEDDDYSDIDGYIIVDNDLKPVKKGFFERIVDRIKSLKIVKRLTCFVLAILTGFGLYSCQSRRSLTGQMVNNPTSSISGQPNPDQSQNNTHDILIIGDNTNYNHLTPNELIGVTTNETQSNAMANLTMVMNSFNSEFANKYVEKGKNIKAALTFDELVALQNAYNGYSTKQIKAYFNGTEVRKDELTDAYKTGSMQLAAAYVIENAKYPVNMLTLIEGAEGKQFYQKYHDLFLKAKTTTGKGQLKYVKEFYDNVRKDFPVSIEERTEGMSHADDRKIEPYKLSVTPMITAAEMLFCDLEEDYTLTDNEMDFINDLGLCNYAQSTFERIETISLSAQEDKENPTFEQYRNAIIKEAIDKDMYVIDDNHRELTKLDSFTDALKINNVDYQTINTSKKSVSYSEEVTETEREIPKSVKNKIDQEINQENQQAKKQGESNAESERQRQQRQADQAAQKINSEVAQDEKDMQQRISQANNNGRVNESDFGEHGVTFDNNHSDNNGNLNGSVNNITTDSNGDQTEKNLPDPNKTGKKFDGVPTGASQQDDILEELSDEELKKDLVDAYVEELAAQGKNNNNGGHQYRYGRN